MQEIIKNIFHSKGELRGCRKKYMRKCHVLSSKWHANYYRATPCFGVINYCKISLVFLQGRGVKKSYKNPTKCLWTTFFWVYIKFKNRGTGFLDDGSAGAQSTGLRRRTPIHHFHGWIKSRVIKLASPPSNPPLPLGHYGAIFTARPPPVAPQ